jgi:hypothetical protein
VLPPPVSGPRAVAAAATRSCRRNGPGRAGNRAARRGCPGAAGGGRQRRELAGQMAAADPGVMQRQRPSPTRESPRSGSRATRAAARRPAARVCARWRRGRLHARRAARPCRAGADRAPQRPGRLRTDLAARPCRVDLAISDDAAAIGDAPSPSAPSGAARRGRGGERATGGGGSCPVDLSKAELCHRRHRRDLRRPWRTALETEVRAERNLAELEGLGAEESATMALRLLNGSADLAPQVPRARPRRAAPGSADLAGVHFEMPTACYRSATTGSSMWSTRPRTWCARASLSGVDLRLAGAGALSPNRGPGEGGSTLPRRGPAFRHRHLDRRGWHRAARWLRGDRLVVVVSVPA